MTIYRAFYDASGRDHAEGRVVVVGVVSQSDKWPKFEAAWNAVLGRFEISFHHHKDYVACNGEFKKWRGNHPDRTKYAAALLGVCKQGIQKSFLVSIANESIEEVTRRYKGFFREDGGGAYALAGNVARRSVEHWLSDTKRRPWSVQHVFEHGDTNQDLLVGMLKSDHPDDYEGFSILPKRDKEGQYVRQFEASDFLAWEARRLTQDADRGERRKPRALAVEIARHLPIDGAVATTDQLIDIGEKGIASGAFPRRQS